jgi:hypothetical protein
MSRARDMANLGAQAGSGLDASDITTGTLGNTVQDNITRLGTVTTGTFSGTIGDSSTQASNRIIKYTKFTEENNNYANLTTDVKTTGNGITFTTTSQTSKVIIVCSGRFFAYQSASVNLANGYASLYFHSDDSSNAATPSGSIIGNDFYMGGYITAGTSARKDLYLPCCLVAEASVSASTAYHIQLCVRKSSGYYFAVDGTCQGYVMEVK